jgi:hypothetical protein
MLEGPFCFINTLIGFNNFICELYCYTELRGGQVADATASEMREIVNFDLNCKSFYNRTANHLITTINYSIIPFNFIAPVLCSADSRLKEGQTDKDQVNTGWGIVYAHARIRDF